MCYRSKLFLSYFIFKLVYFFKPGQFVLTYRSICFNRDQFGTGEKHRSQPTSRRSLLANTGSILNIH